MRSNLRHAFTLVELLVVITIIGILVSLLMPAVQSAREAGRRSVCSNNIKQLATGCLQHLQTNGHFPTGGWGWGWAGMPDRGFTKRQPGGWHYNVLPYIEQGNLWALGKGDNRDEVRQRLETPLTLYNCPSRRICTTYSYTHGSMYFNSDRPAAIGRSDYAACSGDKAGNTGYKGPGTLSSGDGMSYDDWNKQAGTSLLENGDVDATGVIFRRSECKSAHVRDGESCTYLLGERYVDPDHYLTGVQYYNDQGWDLGYDYDVNRWTRDDNAHKPTRDTPGLDKGKAFGSAHPANFFMAFCDGSVHPISYNIDQETHRSLGNRIDGTTPNLEEVLNQ